MRMSVLCLSMLLSCAPCLAGTPLPDSPHLIVNGEGKASTTPDMARLTFNVRVEDLDAGVAKRAVDDSVNRLLAVAPTFGLRPADVLAASVSMSDSRQYGSERRGYVASRQVTVELRNIERLSALTDAGIAAGMTIQAITFRASREGALRKRARGEAATDARRKAHELAEGFGARAGAIYSINSVGSMSSDRYAPVIFEDAAPMSAPAAPPGVYLQPTIEFTEQVSAVFELDRT